MTSEERRILGGFFVAVNAIQRKIDHELARQTEVTLSGHAALWQLSQADDGSLRMADLAAGMGVTPSRITRLVTVLEGQGFVLRTRAFDDGRGWNVVLTGIGRARLERIDPLFSASARRNFFDHVDRRQLHALSALLASITST